MSVDDLLARFEEYMIAVGMAPATIANYLADIRDFAGWARSLNTPGLLPLGVTGDHIRRYCQSLRLQGRSVSTINRRLQAMRKFYDSVVQMGYLVRNPAREVERLSGRSGSSPRVLDRDEANQLVQAVGDGSDGLSRRDRAILLLLLETGLKASELVDLCADDVVLDVGSGYLLVGQDVESGGRYLSLGSETCAALRAHVHMRAPAPGVENLFLSRQGQSLSVRSVQRLVSRRAQAAGLEGVSAHTLRYTFAHDALEEYRDPAEVARMLGLRDAGGVRRYRD